MVDLKSKIVATALKQVEKAGPDGVSLRKIASELGITHPAIYTYFRSKGDLLETLKLTVLTDLKSFLLKGLNPHAETRILVAHISSRFVDFVSSRESYFRLLFGVRGNKVVNNPHLFILEQFDELLKLTGREINIPQIFWYSLIGHTYAYWSGEITKTRKDELIYELTSRLTY